MWTFAPKNNSCLLRQLDSVQARAFLAHISISSDINGKNKNKITPNTERAEEHEL